MVESIWLFGGKVADFVHPYIPNSVPQIKREMLKEIGVKDIEELFADIPPKLRLKRLLELPYFASEYEVNRHVRDILSKNQTYNEMSTFLGAGCWPHFIPAVVDEIIGRAEFADSYTGPSEARLGLLQALFEYQSMIAEITAMDVVCASLYDWASAVGESARMAARVTGRSQFLVPKIISPERLAVLRSYTEPANIRIELVDYTHQDGQLDIADFKSKISSETAGVYIENPTYLGFIEEHGEEISEGAHARGALFVVGVDPTSLGVLRPPGEYGADIVVGEGQPLGNHMNYGGTLLGIFACRDEKQLMDQMPGKLIGMTATLSGDAKGFCETLSRRHWHWVRERATSHVGTSSMLCAVAAAAYLALLGPLGLRELGETIMQKSHYAMNLISDINDVKTPIFDSAHFKEFTVNFDATDKNVSDLHKALLKHGIHGGKDITREFPELGKSALYCVTEVHSRKEIESLAQALRKAVG